MRSSSGNIARTLAKLRGRGIRLRVRSRDQEWRMGAKDPTASVPVAGFDAVPAGPLPGGRRWARHRWWSKVQIEGVCPLRRRLRGRRDRSRRRWWWRGNRSRLQAVKPCSKSLGLGQDPRRSLCWWSVPPERTNTTTVRSEHTWRRVQLEAEHNSFAQSSGILSLSSKCPINVQGSGIYR